jgi:terminase, large subunit
MPRRWSRSAVIMRGARVNNDINIFQLKAEGWLPQGLALYPGDSDPIEFGFTFAERRVFRKRKYLAASAWAEKYRHVENGRPSGPWRNSAAPYSSGIMDASFFPSVEEITVCKPPQAGITEAILTCIGYVIDRDPGAMMCVYPDQAMARKTNKDRIQPMLEKTRQIRKYKTGVDDDVSSLTIRLKNMAIYMAWAHSVSSLGSTPVRYLILDECDKYPTRTTSKEASPEKLAKKRTNTFRGMRKIWIFSTPTVEPGIVWQSLLVSQLIFDFWVVCPECGEAILMNFKHIKWPKSERSPARVRDLGLAWYECVCQAKWDDFLLAQAARDGFWRSRESRHEDTGEVLYEARPMMDALEAYRPRTIGFHLPAWPVHFISLSESAAAFLEAYDGAGKVKDLNALKDFQNAHAAEPWKDYTVNREVQAVLNLKDERPMGLVPGGGRTAVLIGEADTQDNGFFYEIRAFGWGLIQDSWQVRFGFVDSVEALLQVLYQDSYKDSSGQQYPVRVAMIDSQGHRTSEIYDVARLNRGRMIAVIGKDTLATPYAWSNIDTYPSSNKPIPGGLKVLRVNTGFFKNALSSKLGVAPGDPGAYRLNSDATAEYARQMCVEYINEKGAWECPNGKANHYWDCGVYGLAGADLLGVKFWREKKREASPAKVKRDAQRKKNPFTGGVDLFG